MIQIEVNFDVMMAMRRARNAELYANDQNGGALKELYVKADESVIFHTTITNPSDQWATVQNFVNQPILFYDRRIVCPNLNDTTTWSTDSNGVPRSLFSVTPEPGWRYILTHSIVRFPSILKLVPTNKLHYQVWLSLDNTTPPAQPTIDLVYADVADLFRKATAPFVVAPSAVPELGPAPEVEVLYQYADAFTFKGAPIVLRASLGEKIDLYLEADQPFLDTQGNPITQDCNIALNFKRTPEF